MWGSVGKEGSSTRQLVCCAQFTCWALEVGTISVVLQCTHPACGSKLTKLTLTQHKACGVCDGA